MRGKFTPEQREQHKQTAWQMHTQGMSELNISIEIGVAQSTVHYWLQEMRRRRARS